ncbi:MAG: galactokinase, partial [Pseudoclavibacter sp.]
ASDGHDVFYDARGRDVSLIEAPDMAAAGLARLLVGTGESHRNWSDPFLALQASGTRVADALGVQTLREVRLDDLEARAGELDAADLPLARHIITEIQRTLDLTRILRTEGPAHTGSVLRASQASLRDNLRVSTERLDAVCELADHLGAIGARMSGSGLGGSVFVLLESGRVDDFTTACTEMFREREWGEPAIREVAPAAGTRRDA